MKLLIVIPAYNESKSIAEVIERIPRHFNGIDEKQVIVINDGSSDETSVFVGQTKKAALVILPFNVGIGAAIQTGFKYAERNNYDIVIRVDGDGQHKPEEIKKVLKPVLNGKVDLAIGSRFLDCQSSYPIDLSRRIGQKIISHFVSFIIRQKITDATSGFRCYNRQVIIFLNHYYPIDYPEPEEIILLKKNNFKIKEIGVQMKGRAEGDSSLTFLKSLYYMVKVILSIFVNFFRAQTLK